MVGVIRTPRDADEDAAVADEDKVVVDGDRVAVDGDKVAVDGDKVAVDGDRVVVDAAPVRAAGWRTAAATVREWDTAMAADP